MSKMLRRCIFTIGPLVILAAAVFGGPCLYQGWYNCDCNPELPRKCGDGDRELCIDNTVCNGYISEFVGTPTVYHSFSGLAGACTDDETRAICSVRSQCEWGELDTCGYPTQVFHKCDSNPVDVCWTGYYYPCGENCGY
jgi:hypothetical protein